MTAKNENLDQMNFEYDAALWALGDRLKEADFSHESTIRYTLRQRLMNDLHSKPFRNHSSRRRLRLSPTWLTAIFLTIIAATVLISTQLGDSPSYSSFIRQQDSTSTIDPVFLTITPIVGDANATLRAMPSVTPIATTIRVEVMPLDSVISTYNISHWELDQYRLVVVATQDIPANTTIEADMLTEILMPIEVAPPLGYSSVEMVTGMTFTSDIQQWSPIDYGIEGNSNILLDQDHVAMVIPPTSPVVEPLKLLEEGERFNVSGIVRYLDLGGEFQTTLDIASLVAPTIQVEGTLSSTQGIIEDVVIIKNDYQRDFRGCLHQPAAVDAGTGEYIPIVSPMRYPCLITISVPAEDAETLSWALEAGLPMAINSVDTD